MNIHGSVLIRYFGGAEDIVIQGCTESISDGCFYCCKSLCEVTFESDSKLKEIGKSAFCDCKIKSIRIPSNVKVIGEWCFSGCKALCDVTFESGSKLKKIHNNAFKCSLKRVRVPPEFAVGYRWPRHCRIEYYEQTVSAERKKWKFHYGISKETGGN
jgi:hypothetical protein